MRVQRFGLTITQLRAIPEAERSLIVVLAHALNEVNVLNKLTFLSTRFSPEPQWLAHAEAAQTFIIARTLIGKLNEGWDVIQRGFFRTKLSKEYQSLLEPSATEALRFLKGYFGRTNLVNTVRNNFGFHYSLEHAKTAIPDEALPDDLAIYLHETNGNSLYYFSEYLMTKALIEEISPGDPEAALGTLLDEMSAVISHLNEFVQGLLFVVFAKYIGEGTIRSSVTAVELGSVPESATLRIPFFFEISRPGDASVA